MKYTLDDKEFSEATVDGITLFAGGKAEELNDDQVKRLKDVGVKLKPVEEENKPAAPTPAPAAVSGTTGRSNT